MYKNGDVFWINKKDFNTCLFELKLYVSALKHLWRKSDEMILVSNNLVWKLYVLSIYNTFKYPSDYSRNAESVIEQIIPYDMA